MGGDAPGVLERQTEFDHTQQNVLSKEVPEPNVELPLALGSLQQNSKRHIIQGEVLYVSKFHILLSGEKSHLPRQTKLQLPPP